MTALLVEVAHAAGLLATRADAQGDPVWVPTDAFDAWTAQEHGQRWLLLVHHWLAMPRVPGRVGSRDPGGKGRNALGTDLTSPIAAETRRMTLQALTSLPAGDVLAAGTGVPSLVAHVAWLRPRRPAQPSRAGRVGRRGGRRARAARTRRRRVVRRAAAGRGRVGGRGRARPAAARAGHAGARAGRPHRRRAGSARDRGRAPAPPRRGGRVARRGDRLPLHARRRSAARSTSAGRPWRSTTSSTRSPRPRSRSRCATSSTTPPARSARSGSVTPRRSCGPTTRPR